MADHSPQILSMLVVALFSLMNTPLLICLRRNSCRTFFTLGDTWGGGQVDITPRRESEDCIISHALVRPKRYNNHTNQSESLN